MLLRRFSAVELQGVQERSKGINSTCIRKSKPLGRKPKSSAILCGGTLIRSRALKSAGAAFLIRSARNNSSLSPFSQNQARVTTMPPRASPLWSSFTLKCSLKVISRFCVVADTVGYQKYWAARIFARPRETPRTAKQLFQHHQGKPE
jgi:hypothetical protein